MIANERNHFLTDEAHFINEDVLYMTESLASVEVVVFQEDALIG